MRIPVVKHVVLVLAASTLTLIGCRDRGPGSATSTVAGRTAGGLASHPGALTAADLAEYARGREREVALLRDALRRLGAADGDSSAKRVAMSAAAENRVEGEGALAAGLTPDRYRSLTVLVDSALRGREVVVAGGVAQAARSPSNDAGSADDWRRLDSLRVELAVLRSRFAAAAGDAP